MRTLLLLLCLVLAGCTTVMLVSAAGSEVRPPDPIVTVEPSTLALAPGQQGTFTWTVRVPAAVTVTNRARITFKVGGVDFEQVSPDTTVAVAEEVSQEVVWRWPIPDNAQFVSGEATLADGTKAPVAVGLEAFASLGDIGPGQQATVRVTVKAK